MKKKELPPDLFSMRGAKLDDKSMAVFLNSDPFVYVFILNTDSPTFFTDSWQTSQPRLSQNFTATGSLLNYDGEQAQPFYFLHMMFYHDGLRIIAAETARHSSKLRAPPSDHSLSHFHPSSHNKTNICFFT
jgi:hypothetical protein